MNHCLTKCRPDTLNQNMIHKSKESYKMNGHVLYMNLSSVSELVQHSENLKEKATRITSAIYTKHTIKYKSEAITKSYLVFCHLCPDQFV